MAKVNVTITEDKVTFTDSKGKTESLELFEGMPDLEAIRAIVGEQKAAQSASKAAVSLLAHILDNPRLDSYRGKTGPLEAVPNELKAAIRDIETEYLKPIFSQPHIDKGAKPATIERMWQEYAGGLKSGGSYAVAKSFVTMYFAYSGHLPVAPGGKLFTVAALKKMVAALKDAEPKADKPTLADKLFTISGELEARTENTELGDPAGAIASLKAMLAIYEELQKDNADAAMVAHASKAVGDVTSIAANAVAQAAQETEAA